MSFKGQPSQILRETSLTFVNNQKCRSSLTRIIPLYFDSQLCAGHLPGGRDACQVIIAQFFNFLKLKCYKNLIFKKINCKNFKNVKKILKNFKKF